MEPKVDLKTVYTLSEDLVAREVQGEFIIIPITSGIGDSEDQVFTLNETARAIWDRVDGKKTLSKIACELNLVFQSSLTEIERDVLGLAGELLKRRMIVAL